MKELYKSQYARLFLIGLLLFTIASIFSVGYHHPDEHFQILEFCNYKLGNSPAADLTWEFQSKSRQTIQPYLAYAIIKALHVIGIENPFTHAFILRLLTGLLSWFIICKLCLLLIHNFTTEKGKKLFIAMALFLWFVPYIYVRFSSEILSGITFLYAIYFLLLYLKEGSQKKILYLVIIGLLLGFSFFFRFQNGAAIIGLALWILFVKRMKFKEIITITLAGVLSIAFCIFLDSSFYGTFVFTPYSYFFQNLVLGKAAGWGVTPWWSYFTLFIMQSVPPLGIALLLFFIVGLYNKPTDPFSFCIIIFLIVHMMVGHKEVRFLYPLLFGFTYLTAIGIDSIIAKNKWNKPLLYTFYIAVCINIPFLIYRTLVPAQEAMVCYRFLYNYCENNPTTILCKEKSVYNLVGQKVNFYKPKNVNVIVLKNDSDIIAYLHKTNLKKVLIVSRKTTLDSTFSSLTQKRVFCLFPDWLLKTDFNGWVERVNVWSVHEVEPQKQIP